MLLADAPQGYAAAVGVLCTFPPDLLTEACFEALDFVSYKIGAMNVEGFRARLQSCGSAEAALTEKQVQTAINALVFTLREAVKAAVTPDDLVAGLKSAGASVWTGRATKVLKAAWTARRDVAVADAAALRNTVFNVGQLVDFKWSLGVSIESSHVGKVARPFVTVAFVVAGADGSTKPTTLELSLAQFQNLATHLRDMSTAFETV